MEHSLTTPMRGAALSGGVTLQWPLMCRERYLFILLLAQRLVTTLQYLPSLHLHLLFKLTNLSMES